MIFRRRKPHLTLHIGLGKTGTTALQQFFWSNRKRLAQQGITYPDYGSVSNAHHRLSPFSTSDLTAIWDFIPVEEWAPKLAKERHPHTLLSSELIVAADADTTRAFCKEVRAHFNARIVVYLRRQDHILMASYNQNVKSGKQIRRLGDVYQTMQQRFDYKKLLLPWADCLGNENVIVRPYEHSQFYSGDIRYDFLFHALGIENPANFIIEDEDPNPRLDADAVEYKRMLNSIVTDDKRQRRLQELFSEFSRTFSEQSSDSRHLLSPTKRLEILEHFEPSNAEIARILMHRPNGQLFLEPPPSTDSSWQEFSLSRDRAAAITDFLVKNDPRLMVWLEAELPRHLDSERPVVRTAAKRLTAIIQSVQT